MPSGVLLVNQSGRVPVFVPWAFVSFCFDVSCVGSNQWTWVNPSPDVRQ